MDGLLSDPHLSYRYQKWMTETFVRLVETNSAKTYVFCFARMSLFSQCYYIIRSIHIGFLEHTVRIFAQICFILLIKCKKVDNVKTVLKYSLLGRLS